jgi:predicted DNA-binding transcriptional regulator AlpA
MTARSPTQSRSPFGAAKRPIPPRLALRRSEAAAALGVSDEVFDAHIRPELPVVRLGSVRVYPVSAIEAWLAERASSPAEDMGMTG